MKFRSSSLVVYNNELTLGGACVFFHKRLTEQRQTRVTVIISQKVLCVTSHHFTTASAQNVLLQHERKQMDVDVTCQQHVPKRATKSALVAVDGSFQFVDVRSKMNTINAEHVTNF